MSGNILSIEQVAVACNRSRRTIERWIAAGELPQAMQVGPSMRWRAEDITAWLQDRERRLKLNYGDNLVAFANGIRFAKWA
jgi:excisionase family DNA binding protein